MRNVIERIFGRIKKWKILSSKLSVQYDPIKIHNIFSIIASFHNMTLEQENKTMYSDMTRIERDVDYMIARSKLKNNIKTHAAAVSKGWKTINDSSDFDFVADYNMDDIRDHACGPYSLDLAGSYYHHANNIKFRVHPNYPDTLCCCGILSRHRRNDKVSPYCKSGTRTVGMCAHMTASLIVLLHRIHNVHIPEINIKSNKYKLHCLDCAGNASTRTKERKKCKASASTSPVQTASSTTTRNETVSDKCSLCGNPCSHYKCAVNNCNVCICMQCGEWPQDQSLLFCDIHKNKRITNTNLNIDDTNGDNSNTTASTSDSDWDNDKYELVSDSDIENLNKSTTGSITESISNIESTSHNETASETISESDMESLSDNELTSELDINNDASLPKQIYSNIPIFDLRNKSVNNKNNDPTNINVNIENNIQLSLPLLMNCDDLPIFNIKDTNVNTSPDINNIMFNKTIDKSRLICNACGLENPHNCCYICSILQGLYSISSFRESYIAIRSILDTNTFPLSYNLGYLFAKMNTHKSKTQRQSIKSITDYLTDFSTSNNDAYDWINTQSDACEFLVQTLFYILKNEGVLIEATYDLGFNFHRLLHIGVDVMLHSDKLTPNKQFSSQYWTQSPHQIGITTPDYYSVIDLDIKHNTLIKCINEFIAPIHSNIKQPLFIDPIPGVTDLDTRIPIKTKQNCLVSLPSVLIFRLKRFDADLRKNNKKVSFPYTLNMTKYIHNSKRNPMNNHIYALRFVIIHCGSVNRGHYKCLTIDCDDNCRLFSDSQHRSYAKSRYKQYFGTGKRGENAYMLGYVQNNCENQYLFAGPSAPIGNNNNPSTHRKKKRNRNPDANDSNPHKKQRVL